MQMSNYQVDNNANSPQYKIIFSNITCRINQTQQGAYFIVIRLGRKSSKHSDKKLLSVGTICFDGQLEVPVEGWGLGNNEFMRRDKCEIMLYRVKLTGGRQSKELIGMASLALGNQMFQDGVKRMKLTNSVDKEAVVECNVKIELGEVDIVSTVNNESKLSQFFTKLDQHSFVSEIQQMPTKTQQNQNQPFSGVIKPTNKKLFIVASQSIKEDNEILQLFHKQTSENDGDLNVNANGNWWKSEEKINNVTQPTTTVSSQDVIRANKGFQDERRELKKMCEDLQKQNQSLVNKLQKLQHQLSHQNTTSTKSITDRPQIPRPAGSILRSSMIKKNNTITPSQPFKNQIGELIQFQKSSQIIQQKELQSLINQKPIQKSDNKLSIKSVFDVLYKPAVNSRIPRHDTSSCNNERQSSFTNKSVSNDERSREHSYSKFDGKKNYKIIGTIKSPSQSQNGSYVEHSAFCQPDHNRITSESPKASLKLINQGLKINSRNHNVFLDFLDKNQKQEGPLEGVLQPTQLTQNLIHTNRTECYKKSRITLEQLDIKTEEKFRKNEKGLKLANMKILEENIQLKQQKRVLLKQIEQKKGLTYEQVFNLKNEIRALSSELQITKKQKLQSESTLAQLSQLCGTLQQENAKLKKQLKQQKIKYEYYFKTCNINDHKEKEKDDSNKGLNHLESAVVSHMRGAHSIDADLNIKRNVSETKSLKKVNFVSRDEEGKLATSYSYQSQQRRKPNIPKSGSSVAVLKLKEQTVLGNRKGLNQNQAFVSLTHRSFTESKESSLPFNFLIGDRIILK